MGLGIQLQVSQLIMSFDAFCLVVMMRTSDKSSLVERYCISLQAVNMISLTKHSSMICKTGFHSIHATRLCTLLTSLKGQLYQSIPTKNCILTTDQKYQLLTIGAVNTLNFYRNGRRHCLIRNRSTNWPKTNTLSTYPF